MRPPYRTRHAPVFVSHVLSLLVPEDGGQPRGAIDDDAGVDRILPRPLCQLDLVNRVLLVGGTLARGPFVRHAAILAHRHEVATNDADHPSFGIVARLMATAANPNGQMKAGQVSPTRKLSDFHRK